MLAFRGRMLPPSPQQQQEECVDFTGTKGERDKDTEGEMGRKGGRDGGGRDGGRERRHVGGTAGDINERNWALSPFPILQYKEEKMENGELDTEKGRKKQSKEMTEPDRFPLLWQHSCRGQSVCCFLSVPDTRRLSKLRLI